MGSIPTVSIFIPHGANEGLVRHWFSKAMPTGSSFYGIVIRMFVNDHPPPHFHARYGEYHVRVSIITGEVIDGELPRRAARLVKDWAEVRRVELEANWRRAEQMEPLRPIEPLR